MADVVIFIIIVGLYIILDAIKTDCSREEWIRMRNFLYSVRFQFRTKTWIPDCNVEDRLMKILGFQDPVWKKKS